MGEYSASSRWARFGYGSVPARKMVPSCFDEPRERTRNNMPSALYARLATCANFLSIYPRSFHFQNNVAASQVYVFRKSAGLHVLHDDAFSGRHIETVGHFRCQLSNHHTEFTLLG